jgi:hypothetical protein
LRGEAELVPARAEPQQGPLTARDLTETSRPPYPSKAYLGLAFQGCSVPDL